MKKAFLKTILRMFKANMGRFIANVLICLISIALSGGLLALTSVYEESYSKQYYSGNVSDVILKCKDENGFSDKDLDSVKSLDTVSDAEAFFVVDKEIKGKLYRFYILDLKSEINKLTLVEGDYPDTTYDIEKPIQVMMEEGNRNRDCLYVDQQFSFNPGVLSSLGIDQITFTVTGIVNSPLYNSVQRENANLESDEDLYISGIFYIDRNLIPETINTVFGAVSTSSFLVDTDIYIVYNGEKKYFTDEYKNKMEEFKDKLVSLVGGEEKAVGLTLEENVSYALFSNYNVKVSRIAFVFPFFFILVCALVNLITITRLIKDERSMIATYLSLGVSKRRIELKYVLFSLISTAIGTIAGMMLGIPLIPKVVLPAYESVFEMGALTIGFGSYLAYIWAVLIVLASVLVTLASILLYLKESPASLMKEKSPKPGKKIFLEHITFFWKRLPFRFKSSFRNIFRQKKNFFLTSLSIIGSTLLVMVGFGLLDISNALVNDALYGNVASSMGTISFVIILFAIAMAVVVIYSLANMNIIDRERELATLKVLGYHDSECSFYTFREIIIIAVLATLIGLPISAGVMAFLFEYLEFGSISDVKPWSYILSFVVVIATTIMVNLLLAKKIKKIDMNDSLKTLD